MPQGSTPPIDSPTSPSAERAGALLTKTIGRMVLSPVSVEFECDRPWGMTDGQCEFPVAVKDPAFLARIQRGEPFSKGDWLLAKVQISQWLVDGDLQTDYVLLEVLEHRGRRDHSDCLPTLVTN